MKGCGPMGKDDKKKMGKKVAKAKEFGGQGKLSGKGY
jgi:hypothetical protein